MASKWSSSFVSSIDLWSHSMKLNLTSPLGRLRLISSWLSPCNWYAFEYPICSLKKKKKNMDWISTYQLAAWEWIKWTYFRLRNGDIRYMVHDAYIGILGLMECQKYALYVIRKCWSSRFRCTACKNRILGKFGNNALFVSFIERFNVPKQIDFP